MWHKEKNQVSLFVSKNKEDVKENAKEEDDEEYFSGKKEQKAVQIDVYQIVGEKQENYTYDKHGNLTRKETTGNSAISKTREVYQYEKIKVSSGNAEQSEK